MSIGAPPQLAIIDKIILQDARTSEELNLTVLDKSFNFSLSEWFNVRVFATVDSRRGGAEGYTIVTEDIESFIHELADEITKFSGIELKFAVHQDEGGLNVT